MFRSATMLLLVLVTVVCTPPTRAADSVKTYGAYLDGYIDIAPDGSVKDFSMPKRRLIEEHSLASALSRQIRAWRFQLVFTDGPPAIARVSFGIYLRGEMQPKSNQMLVRFSDVHFYDRVAADPSGKPAIKMQPPVFPEEPGRAGVGAEIDMLFKLAEDGAVMETGISKLALLLPEAVSPAESERFAREFRDASFAAAKQWTFSPAQRSTCGQPCLVRVPVRFSPCACSRGIWSGLQMVPTAPLPWATTQDPIVDAGVDGSPASVHQLIDPTQAQGQL